MAGEFDPYLAWLGIRETARPLSHYQLLGLEEFEENALAISIAADAAAARLKHADPGERRGRWQQTLDEVTLAKLCLTNRTRKTQYDNTLRARRGTAPTAFAPTTSGLQPPASSLQPVRQDLLPPTFPPQTPARPASVPLAQPTLPMEPRLQPVAYAQPVFAAASHPFSEAVSPASLSGTINAPITVGAFSPQPASTFDPKTELNPGSARERRKHPAPNAKLWGMVAVVALVLLSSFVVFKALSRPEARLAATPPTATDGTVSSGITEEDSGSSASQSVIPASTAPKIVAPSAPAGSTPAPLQPASKPKSSRAVAMTQIELPPEKPATKPTPPPASRDDPDPEPQPSAQTPEQKAAFEQALRNARAAMGARQLPQAQQELKTAKANVGTAEQDTQFARMQELYGYVEGFWKAVLESMKGLQATDTLPIDNTEIAIVEVDGEKLTIRAAGRNLSYTLETMPSGLALVLAKRWFKEGVAANSLYLGAFHAVDPQGNLNEARRCWAAATRGGANAESLMPLLDARMPAFVAEQQAVPKRSTLTKMRAALRRSMAAEFRMARTLDQKLSLARQLLDAAQQNKDPVQRYALLDEALNLAIAAGSAADINAAVDGLIAGYELDAWELRAAAFDQAASDANNPLVAKALAQELVEIVDRAIAEKQPIAALKLCNALLSAAKAGKDLELARAAREKKSELTGSGD